MSIRPLTVKVEEEMRVDFIENSKIIGTPSAVLKMFIKKFNKNPKTVLNFLINS